MSTDRPEAAKTIEFPVTTRMMPATQGMLMLVRDELTERITLVEVRLTQQLTTVRSEIREKTSEIRAEVFRTMALNEEQRAQNNIVVEGTHGVIQRQERIERTMAEGAEAQQYEHARIFAELQAHEVRSERIEAAILQQGADLLVLRRGQAELKSDVAELLRGQAELKSDVAELKRGQAELRSDVAELKRGQAKLEANVAELQRGQAELQSDVAELKRGQAKLEANVAELQRGQDEMAENIREILTLLKGRAGA